MFSGLLLCSSKVEHRTRVMTALCMDGPFLSQRPFAREIDLGLCYGGCWFWQSSSSSNVETWMACVGMLHTSKINLWMTPGNLRLDFVWIGVMGVCVWRGRLERVQFGMHKKIHTRLAMDRPLSLEKKSALLSCLPPHPAPFMPYQVRLVLLLRVSKQWNLWWRFFSVGFSMRRLNWEEAAK